MPRAITLEQIASIPALQAGWRRVRANGGTAGGDGVTSREFESTLGSQLQALSAAVLSGRYRPGHLREIRMTRPDGRIRLLRIPDIADRVVQTACHMVLSRQLDPRMSGSSFGYRPARSVPQALCQVRALIARGHCWVVDADIMAFFDTVDHGRLRDDLAIWIDDPKVIRLIGLWLNGFGRRQGLAQGAPISPILANLFLHPVDLALNDRGGLVRYADDFVIMTRSRSQARATLRRAGRILQRRGLNLHPDKTGIRGPGEQFEFLGAQLVIAG